VQWHTGIAPNFLSIEAMRQTRYALDSCKNCRSCEIHVRQPRAVQREGVLEAMLNAEAGGRGVRSIFRGTLYQNLAALFCLLFGVAIIINVQMAGDSVWFWYATLLHQGVKLYGQLHLPLQPFYVLEVNAWMQLAGRKCIPYETLSVLHITALCVGLWLLLRESNWPDWQKAIVLGGTFFCVIHFNAYRFDDFHIVADNFVVYSLVLLLWLARATSEREEICLSIALGVISGLAILTRITDGGTLFAAAGFCIPFLARRQRVLVTLLFLVSTLLAAWAVIALTGDSVRDYAMNSIFHAASAKGGTGTVLHGPWVALKDNFARMRTSGKWLMLWLILISAAGALAQRLWKISDGLTVVMQCIIATAGFAYSSALVRHQLLDSAVLGMLSTFLQPLSYLLGIVAVIRFLGSKMGSKRPAAWDAREMLSMVVIATLLACAASQALLFILLPVLWEYRGKPDWMRASVVTIIALTGLSGMTYKIHVPYSWNAYAYRPMFQDRVIYHHPVYGTMYIDRDLLGFIQPVCAEIASGGPNPELLSMPYPYPNYFCAIPPWHGYVQTWFDTATPQTIAGLMAELQSSPPQWILYQRQLSVLHSHEVEYNRGQPIAHRYLDEMIMQKIASGQWQLVDKRNYLEGDGWFLIRTHE